MSSTRSKSSRRKVIAFPDPARAAHDLLVRAGIETPSVTLERIVDLWPGLILTEEPLEGDGYLVDLGASGGEILVNGRAPAGRRRFTVAHEIGHWVLRERGGVGVVDCRSRSSRLERWCDHFATELLTPTDWLRADMANLGLSDLGRLTFVLPRRYRVSSAMANLRLLEELKAVAVVERLRRRGRETWSPTVNPQFARAMVDDALPWIRNHFSSSRSGNVLHPTLPIMGLFAFERTKDVRRSACLLLTKHEAKRLAEVLTTKVQAPNRGDGDSPVRD